MDVEEQGELSTEDEVDIEKAFIENKRNSQDAQGHARPGKHIAFHEVNTPEHEAHDAGKSIYVPGPRERAAGEPLIYHDREVDIDEDVNADVEHPATPGARDSVALRRRHAGPGLAKAISMERVSDIAGGLFILGREHTQGRSRRASVATQRSMPQLSRQVTVGHNSEFRNLTRRDREVLGGIEYRALKLLLKIVTGYFFGLHILGAICLVAWIRHCDPKYTDYLEAQGQDKIWWAIYSAQTMFDNLGFTLTQDSMVSFRDATWPMLLMTFLALAGNTMYPCLLRLTLWTMKKFLKQGETYESLCFLLEHPRRCYTLLFPSKQTWYLLGTVLGLNVVDMLLIILCDLKNKELTALSPGPRLLAAIFQSASSRHTGTTVFNLAKVNPAVQASLMVMMYIAVFPIAISIRSSNTYEERSLGLYSGDKRLEEQEGSSYIATHVRNQLSFDLWYMSVGLFCICAAEGGKITEDKNSGFHVFAILFEVVSAYANVGLSLGHPKVTTSLCGQFTTFSKVVICAMMIRGRHRGLPYSLDRAILLPGHREDMSFEDEGEKDS